MLTKEQSRAYRSDLFRHLDGIAIAPSVYALEQKGVLNYILEKESVSLHELVTHFKANEGYLNVALRILCSQGWLEQTVDNQIDSITFSANANSKVAFNHAHLYEDVVYLLKFSEKFHPRKFELEPFLVLEKIMNKYENLYDITLSEDTNIKAIQEQILKHIEGQIVGPTIVRLAMNGMFHKYFMEASFKPEEFHKDPKSFRKILDFFSHLGWFTKLNQTFKFTEKGMFFAKRATAYGVTVSYIPTFRKLDDFIFGDAKTLAVAQGETEQHVDREMNVWGSGGAHSGYFKIVDEIIIELFNKPIDEQPKGILDMGCGNGAFLQHLFEVIERQTKRGKMLDEYPLFLVGVDYNEAALKITRANLIQADIWAKIMWGDIGKPELLAKDLQENYDINLKELLNVRTFLDHNRIWKDPDTINPDRTSISTGSYAYKGRRINNNLVEDSLLEHLKNWEPYVKTFGLLLIELHTIAPELIAENIGRSPATAYDATHGYSDQYIVEVDVFQKIAKEAGLFPDETLFRKFPNNDLATVTINLLRG
ncbi:MAG: class I SAM-dependent methyltransferase [Flavobacteriaceae bacterium]|nr:class I SAM-dependent methyltransferase [Flavobacteriaceae bacterium]